MLAYVFWHRPAPDVATGDYEQALHRFHRSLAHSPPVGLLGSASLRAESLPWLPAGVDGRGEGYEDWYLLESWSAVGVLEAAAVSHGHQSAHREAARRAGAGAGGIYRRIEGHAEPRAARLAVWVSRPSGHSDPTIADLLEDGVAAEAGALWQRALVLGAAPEFCLMHSGAEPAAGTGVAPERLPAGWQAQAHGREVVPDQ